MLLLKAHNPKFETYFGLYYNPGGSNRIDYNWLVPNKIFNMKQDKCILIGLFKLKKIVTDHCLCSF